MSVQIWNRNVFNLSTPVYVKGVFSFTQEGTLQRLVSPTLKDQRLKIYKGRAYGSFLHRQFQHSLPDHLFGTMKKNFSTAAENFWWIFFLPQIDGMAWWYIASKSAFYFFCFAVKIKKWWQFMTEKIGSSLRELFSYSKVGLILISSPIEKEMATLNRLYLLFSSLLSGLIVITLVN